MKKIKQLNDLKVGYEYDIQSPLVDKWCRTVLINYADNTKSYTFISYNGKLYSIRPDNFQYWNITEYEESIVEDKSKPKEGKQLIEMFISGVDHLFNIPFGTTLDKPDDQTENEKFILNLSLYGIISEGGAITIRKAKES